jgi:hypothetical protein
MAVRFRKLRREMSCDSLSVAKVVASLPIAIRQMVNSSTLKCAELHASGCNLEAEDNCLLHLCPSGQS